LAFAIGAIPGAIVGSRVISHLPAENLRKGFGVILIGFAVYFTAHQAL
jgi:uncharacterized membrane protein YfcA